MARIYQNWTYHATRKLFKMKARDFLTYVGRSDNFTSNHHFENQEYLVINHGFKFFSPICNGTWVCLRYLVNFDLGSAKM